MKKSVIVLTYLFLAGCSIKVLEATTTHKQIMDSYKTKDKIVARFGLPTTKKTEGDYEEWYYDYGTKTVTDAAAVGSSYSGSRSVGALTGGAVAGRTATGNPAVAAAAVAGSRSVANSNSSARSRTVTQDVKSYVKFTLKGENVVTWESNNVDYGKYEYVKKKMFSQN